MKNLIVAAMLLFTFSAYSQVKSVPPPKLILKKDQKIQFRNDHSAEVYVGYFADLQFGWEYPPGGSSALYYTMGTGALSSTAAYTVTTDGCSGATLSPGGSPCWVTVRFEPSVAGYFLSTYNIAYTAVMPNPIDNVNSALSNAMDSRSRDVPLDEDGNPIPPVCPSVVTGSIVRVEAQSLGENIPVVGTKIYLNYSSEQSQGYVASFNTVNRRSNFNPEAWSVSIHHLYDLQSGYLYLGSGTSMFRRNMPRDSSGNYSVLSPDGSEVFVFNGSGKHLSTKSSLTGAVKYTFNYNGGNKITSIIDAYSNTTTFNRDSSGILISVTAPFGQVTSVTTDSNGRLESVTNPNSESYQFTYKSGTDLLETFTKPGGQVSTFTYSSSGRLTKDLGHGGNFWELLEDLQVDQRVTTKSSNLGRSEVLYSWGTYGNNYTYSELPSGQEWESQEGYDGWNGYYWTPQEDIYYSNSPDPRFGKSLMYRTAEYFYRDGNTKTTNYTKQVYPPNPTDIFSFTTLSESENTNGRTKTSTYTKSNNTRIVTSPEGATQTRIIDNQENLVSSQVGSDLPTTATYNSAGQLYQVVEDSNVIMTNAYNSQGFLYKSTDSFNNETTYYYDLAGRVSQITYPNGKFVTYSYDSNGNVVGVTPPSRPEHVFEFNAMELLSEYQPPTLSGLTAKDTLYSYNLDKQLTNILRPDGQSITNVYDSTTGLLDQVQLARGNNSIQYMSSSNLIEQISSADGILSSYSYYGRLLKGEEQKRASDGYLYAGFSYAYDTDHRKVSRTLNGHSTTTPSIINITYNDDDAPTQIGDMQLAYTYPSGRLSTTTLDLISDSRTYDSFGYLESYSATYNPTVGSPTALYSYTLVRDVLHRITEKTETVSGVTNVYEYTYDTLGRLSTVEKDGNPYSDYTYDDNGNRTSGTHAGFAFTATYDNHDRILTYNSRTYSYNANGDNTFIQWNVSQSSSYSYDAFGSLIGATDKLGNALSFRYDGQNRLVQGLVNGVTSYRRLYEGDFKLIAEADDSGSILKEFVHHTNINSADYMILGGNRYRIIKDHLGSVRLVVRADNGTISQRLDYTDLGKVINDTNPNFQPYGYAGGLIEENTGLLKFGSRHYDPEIGRWVSKDPIKFESGSTSFYSYAANDPINFFDFNGLWEVSVSAYAGLGGGIAIGRNCDGSFYGKVRVGIGEGLSASWDKHAENPSGSNPGIATGAYAEAEAGLGPLAVSVGTSSGFSQTGGSYYNKPSPSAPVSAPAKFKFGISASGGVEMTFQ